MIWIDYLVFYSSADVVPRRQVPASGTSSQQMIKTKPEFAIRMLLTVTIDPVNNVEGYSQAALHHESANVATSRCTSWHNICYPRHRLRRRWGKSSCSL